MGLRFDDTLETVLAGDMDSDAGRQSAFRQLVDLVGRGRAPADERTIGALKALARQIPADVRAACSRGLAFACPPAPLVRLFATDRADIAAPVLRNATLEPDDWIALLPSLSPGARAILRHRRDLGDTVEGALKAYEASDFVLRDERAPAEPAKRAASAAPPEGPVAPPVAQAPPPRPPATSFAAFGEVAMGLPVVAEAVSAANARQPSAQPGAGPFAISDVVARIDAFREQRERSPRRAAPERHADHFRFETDAEGTVCWADGPARALVIGLSLVLAGGIGAVRMDNVAAGAFRKRSRFRDARMSIDAASAVAGDWLMSGFPLFDPASGRFQGYRGIVRRPRSGETAAPARRPGQGDAIRQLVHELRTPANAVIGFAEMIGTEMLGPAPEPYRRHADAIRGHARELLAAIDDLDLAARIDSDALTLRAEPVSLRAVIGSVIDDLRPLSELRGAVMEAPHDDRTIDGDRHAIERLFGRLLATLLSATGAQEVIAIQVGDGGNGGMAHIGIARPKRLSVDARMLSDDMADEAHEGDGGAWMPLGSAFSLRLARNLAHELGGSLRFGEDRIDLQLPLIGSNERLATKS
jgi:signal transduction histidine kinase